MGFKLDEEPLKSSVSMSLGGPGFLLPLSAPLSGPVTAQIRSSNGGCWGATFSGEEIKKNDGDKVIAVEKNEFR
ncbi:MAG TPA: hypothetical protein VEL28_00280 [Candidatus Binatia bacterium]|nr:hypothetical protein [Candidatus Binatia bacterium]